MSGLTCLENVSCKSLSIFFLQVKYPDMCLFKVESKKPANRNNMGLLNFLQGKKVINLPYASTCPSACTAQNTHTSVCEKSKQTAMQ